MSALEATTNAATPSAPPAGYLSLYPKSDGLWYYQNSAGVETLLAGSGVGDMIKATYDPTSVVGDVFAMDNMVEGALTKVLTATERTAITTNTAKVGITPAQAADIITNNAKVSDINHVTVLLPNVDNTDDLNKPISTAQQAALDLKVAKTSSTGSAVLPTGTTAQRDGTPAVGYQRWNTTTSSMEVWDGVAWSALGGGGANDIINGQFRVAQAGTSFAPASGSYDLDGWYSLYALTTPGFTVSQGIGSSTGKFARLNTYATAEAVFDTGDYCNNSTKIEGYDAVKYLGNTFTVGFRVRSSVTGVHCLSIHDGTSSYVYEYTINVADTWEYKTITIAGGLQAVASSTNAWGITLHFCNGVGATGQTTAGAWNAGSFYGTVNQVNDLATVGNVFALEDVTMNLGATVIPDSATYEQDLARCQRYLPAFSTIAGTHSVGVGGMVNTTVGYFVIPFLVETRGTVTSAVLSSVSHFTRQGVAAPVATGLGVFVGGKNSALLSLTFPAAVAGVSTLVFTNAAGTLRFEGARL